MDNEKADGSGDRLWSRFIRDAIENSPEFNHAFGKEAELFRELAANGELGERVTVMCCGDGREVESLLDLHAEFPQLKELNAVDWLKVSIDQVRERVRGKIDGLEGVDINLLQEDATATSIAPGSQDTVTCMLTMVNFDDGFIEKFCAHVNRILKPGGKFIFSVYNQDAFDSRMKLYTKMGAPIESVDPKTGYVAFESGFEEAGFSRQFTPEQFRQLVGKSDLDVRSYDGDGITHLGVLEKEKVQRAQGRVPAWHQLAIATSLASILGLAVMNAPNPGMANAEDADGWRTTEIAPGVFMRVNYEKGLTKGLFER